MNNANNILNINHQTYPYGMVMDGRHGQAEDGYRYGFQGQEKDDEIKDIEGSSLNYKFRMHDPRIGRFFARDPLASSYPWNSPYAFSENRVIDSRELEGLEKESAIFGEATDIGTAKLVIVDDIKLYYSLKEHVIESGFDILYIARTTAPDEDGIRPPYSIRPSEYARLVGAYCKEHDTKLDALILVAHANPDGLSISYTDEENSAFRSTEKMNGRNIGEARVTENPNVGMNVSIDDFVKMVGNIKEGGDFVLASCRLGQNENFTTELLNSVDKDICIYANKDKTSFSTASVINYPLSDICNFNSGWTLTNISGTVELNSAIKITNSGIELCEPAADCSKPITPEGE